MDRRRRKTRNAIFKAFVELLSKKSFDNITVGEIIELSDVGRSTFYSHFETKDYLLKEFCEELFCHIFDTLHTEHNHHEHIFNCDNTGSVFLHLFRHLKKNDNNILELLSCQNNDLFLGYFKTNLRKMVISQLPMFEKRKSEILPRDFWIDHIASVFTDTVRWWINDGLRVSPEDITEYFYLAV